MDRSAFSDASHLYCNHIAFTSCSRKHLMKTPELHPRTNLMHIYYSADVKSVFKNKQKMNCDCVMEFQLCSSTFPFSNSSGTE